MNILNLFKKPQPKTVESITASVVKMVDELDTLAEQHEAAHDALVFNAELLYSQADDRLRDSTKARDTADKFRALFA